MSAFLSRIMAWRGRRAPPTREPQADPLHDHLRAAVAAEARAKTANAQTYQARVEAMIDDFFVKYGSRDVRRLL